MRRSSLLLSLMLVYTLSVLGAPVAAAKSKSTPAGAIVVDPSEHIQPLLQAAAQVDPTSTVRVIVQKTSTTADSSDIAKAAKAKFKEEFSIIPAFTANVKLGELMALAQDPNVRYVSMDAMVKHKSSVDASRLATSYPQDVGAPAVWNVMNGLGVTGAGVTVAVVDTGLDLEHPDFHGNVSAVNVNLSATDAVDGYGHGTHVAGIIGAHNPNGQYIGVAPNATVIGVKIADDAGNASESDLLRGLDWVYLNQQARHIRVVNLSVGASIADSYATSPTDAAVEHLWFNGVTVVTAAGNLGAAADAVSYAPANDPFVVTVGCLDDNQTPSTSTDDSLCPISSRGVTQDGFAKPEVVAPGRKVVSSLASGAPQIARDFASRITTDGQHVRLSGTSMAAPVVTGVVALLLERYSTLTPDQVKSILISSATAYPVQADSAGEVNARRALNQPILKGPTGNQTAVRAVGISSSAGFGSVLWDGSRWTAATWDGSRWTNTRWDGSRWTNAFWDGSRWTTAAWDGSRWTSSGWDGSRWTNTNWNGSRWTASSWDGSRWTSAYWNGATWDKGYWDAASAYD